ncbi:hypothetical protein DEDE109153_10870 [Deinococcus deserti]
MLVGVQIGDAHLEQIVDITQTQKAFQNLGALLHLAGKLLKTLFGLLVERNAHHDHQLTAHLLLVQQRHVALDDPFFLQAAHTAQGRSWRQPDLVGKFGVGNTGIALQDPQNLPVNSVQMKLRHKYGNYTFFPQ